MSNTAAGVVGCPNAALTRPPRTLLAIELPRTSLDLTAPTGTLRPEAFIGGLHHHILVHQRHIRRRAKNVVAQFNGANGLAALVIKCRLHRFTPLDLYRPANLEQAVAGAGDGALDQE